MSDEGSDLGPCIGCGQMGRLRDGVCEGCRDDPDRGVRWAQAIHVVRVQPHAALMFYAQLCEEQRDAFAREMGKALLDGLAGHAEEFLRFWRARASASRPPAFPPARRQGGKGR